MGKDPSTSGTAVTDTSDPEQIQQDIEQTRRELGDTVEALAEKTDVKAQTRRKLAQAKAAASDKRDELVGKAREASPQTVSIMSQTPRTAREHPIPLAIVGALAVGYLMGRRSGG